MLTVADIVGVLEQFAHPALQEQYDNAGLMVGRLDWSIESALITIDITEEVVQEAIDNQCGLIVSHHPLTLGGFKKLTGQTAAERTLLLAVKNDIAIYSSHTNIDAVWGGVSYKMAQKIGLIDCKVLEHRKNSLLKLVTFVPLDYVEKVREAIFSAGAGHIGHYDCCSFSLNGKGSFRGDNEANPFIGEKGTLHFEDEVRLETILPIFIKNRVVKALIASHPYEEVAYDIYTLANDWEHAGFGIVGELPHEEDIEIFLTRIKTVFNCGCIRYTNPIKKKIKRIALCGGAGSSLLSYAIAAKADVFITGDFKYHQFFDADNRIIIADIGHYESEQFTKELFFELLTKKLPNFAVRLSQVNSNPIKYL